MSLVTSIASAIESFLSFYWSITIFVQILVPIVLLTHRFPLRSHPVVRIALVLGTLAAIAIVPLSSGFLSGLTAYQGFIVFSLLLAVLVVAVYFVFDVSVWAALFSATAGYTLQNLSSGLVILVGMLATRSISDDLEGPANALVNWGIPLIVYLCGYLVFVRRLGRNGLLEVNNKAMLLMLAVVAIVIIGFDTLIKDIVFDVVSWVHMILLRNVHAFVCLFVLFVEYELLFAQKMRDEKDVAEAVLAERERQYELSRKNIEAINIKCHDIRHQIRMVAEGAGAAAPAQGVLDDIAAEIDIYDSVVETGNEALDTVLTEKSLACQARGITLSIIADGAALDFMEPSDIYSLFGNALENAIESAQQVDDPEHRIITFNVRRAGAMVAVNMENYCATVPDFRDGLPVSTKGDPVNHGFGTRSIRNTVTRYGGTFHAAVRDGVFSLNLLLPAAA